MRSTDAVACASRRVPPRPQAVASTARAVSATSPSTPKVSVALARRAPRGCRRPGRRWRRRAISRPCRIVHMFSAQPQPTIEVGRADQLGGQRRGEAAGDVERPRVAVEQPLGHRRGREQRAAPVGQRDQGRRGPGARAPRPATKTGRSAPARRACARRRPASGTARGPCAGGSRAGSARVGRRGRLHVERQVQQHRAPLVHGRGDRRQRPRRPRSSADVIRGGTAPTARASAVLVDEEVRPRLGGLGRERRPAAYGSWPPRRCPVIALVSPQPWCTVTAADPARSSGRTRRPSSPRRPRAARRRSARRPATIAFGDVEVARPDDAEDVVDADADQRAADGLGDVHGRRQRSTSASTRAGAPEPSTIGSGPAIDDRAGRRQLARGSAAGSGRTCRCPSGRSGTGTAGRTSAPRPRRCRPSRRRGRAPATPRPPSARTRRTARACAGRSRRR